MINRERARFEMGNVDILMDSRADDPRNARWLLEHHPATRDRWGDRTDTVTDAAAAALALLAARLPPPPPAASLAAAPLSLVDKEDQ